MTVIKSYIVRVEEATPGSVTVVTDGVTIQGDGSVSSPVAVISGVFQDTLVSGTNIKTINGSSVLGAGDLTVGGSSAWGGITGNIEDQTDLIDELDSKQPHVGLYSYGKSIVWFGDSFILGTGASSTAKRLSTIASEYLGATEVNNAAGGTTIEKRTPVNWFAGPNMVDNVATIPAKTSSLSLLVFGYGLNDVGYNGGDYNVPNYITDYNTVLDYAINTRGWPARNILILSPWWIPDAGYATYTGLNGTVPTRARHLSFVEATKEIARSRDTLFLNIYEDFANNNTALQPDNIHPNDDGHLFLANDIVNFLNNGAVQLGSMKANKVIITSTTATNNFIMDTAANAVNFYPDATAHYANLQLHPRGAGSGGVGTQFVLFKTDFKASTSNYEGLFFQAASAGFTIASIRAGTGVQQPIVFRIQATDVFRLTIAGNVNVGTSSSDLAKFYILQAAQSTTWVPAFRVDPGAHTALTANTEFPVNDFRGATMTWTGTGTVPTQRFNFDRAFTVAGSTSATFTDIYGRYTEAPIAGTNATITRNWGLGTNGNLQVQGRAYFGAATTAPTAVVDIDASTTTRASLRVRAGAAPTSPNDGDIWLDSTAHTIHVRINGVTKTFTLT